MQKINKEEYQSLLDSGKTFVVDFYADWCEKCTQMMPVMEEISAEVETPIFKVDIEQFPEIKEMAKIKAIPMVCIYSKGYMRAFGFGIQTKDWLKHKIQSIGNIYGT